MKKIITTLALTAALSLSCSAAFATDEVCTTTQETYRFTESPAIPAVPAVPGIPAVDPVYEMVTEYEYVHKKADHPGSPRWEREGWNAEANPNSVGWEATGNTREVSTGVVLVPGVDAVPEIPAVPEVPAVYRDEVVDVVTCVPADDPIPTHGEPQPITVPDAPAAPAPVVPAVEVVPVAVEAPAEELAYTGAADWVLPAGALALLAGAGAVLAARRNA